ncbi:MAG: hypothetical protein MRJ93_03255 [Nitrososphaeraceae archaeon]|nr:hypothetical protein [Nitrososphaeraceae archaeon]
MSSGKNFFEKRASIYLFLVGLAIFVTGLPTLESFSQSENQSDSQQSGQEQTEGIGSIEQLENLTAMVNTTDQSTGLLEGMELSQSGESVPGEQDVNFEGQGDQSSQSTEGQGNQSSQSTEGQGNQTENKSMFEQLGEVLGLK